MTINTISPATFTTSILIGDPVATPNAGADSIPLMTMIGGKPVSAAIEIQSTDSAVLLPRMTTAQMNAIPNPANGMLIYNTTANQMYSYTAGVWIPVAGGGSGDVIGPGVSIAGDIAVFADTTGKVIADSGVHIGSGELLMSSLKKTALKSSKSFVPLVDPIGLELSNITYLQFNETQGTGLIFVGALMPVEFIDNDFGPSSQICTLFTGDIPSSSTSPSALVELQSTTGALLISRMTTAQRNALLVPSGSAGMMIFNTSTSQFNFYDGTTWLVFSGSSALPPIVKFNQLLTSDSGTAIWTSTFIDSASTTNNLILGTTAAAALTIGTHNTVVGLMALSKETFGSNNCAYGFEALSNQNGLSGSSAFGYQAGFNITSGSGNNIFGFEALANETTGSNNSAFGYQSLTTANGAFYNSAFGSNTGVALRIGFYNSIFGYSALSSETTESQNSAFGAFSLTTQSGAARNSAFGYSSGTGVTTGGQNSFFGAQSGIGIATGNHNIAFGYDTLSMEASGSRNIAIGSYALTSQNGVDDTIAIGYQAGLLLSTGTKNVMVGYNSLTAETVGDNSTAIGYGALSQQTGSSNNTALGYNSGASQAAYTECTFIGSGADASSSGLTNATSIGYNTQVGQSNSLILGNGANVGIGTSTPNTSAILELASTTGSLLLPRMTDGQRNALTAAAGMTIYDTTSSALEFYNGSGWVVISASVVPAALTRTNDTNVTLTLGGTPTTALLQATSITAGWTGQLSLARGGTNASLTANNGGIFYSTATAGAILAGTATANQVLLSGSSTTPAWSTATYPATTTINQLLYSSAGNVIGGLATANSASLVTTSAGVPVWSGTMTNGQLIIGSTGATPTAATLTPGVGISITNGAGTITIAATSEGNWIDQNTGSVTLAAGFKYMIDNGAGLVTLTLPAAPALGDTFEIAGFSSGGWKVAQNALQSIQFSSTSTTPGIGGYAASHNQYDRIIITYAATNVFLGVVLVSTGAITIN